MELKKTYQKARASKPIVTIFFCSLLLLSVGGVWALTTITDQGIVTPTGDYENITAGNFNDVIYFSNEGTGDYSCSLTEDCSDKIQNAVNSLENKGGNIIFKQGTYLIASTININHRGVILMGQSFAGTKWNPVSGDSSVLQANETFTGDILLNFSGSRSGLKNIWVIGSSQVNNGVVMGSGGGGFIIDTVSVSNFAQSGIVAESGSDGGNIMTRVESLNNGLHGIELRRPDWKLEKITSFNNTNGAGIFIGPVGGTIISNSHLFINKYSLYFNGSGITSIVGNIFEQASDHEIYFDSEPTAIQRGVISSNLFYNHDFNNPDGKSYLFFNSSSGNSIDDLTIIGNSFEDDAPIFNFSGSSINRISFTGNLGEGENLDYGNIPNSVNIMDTSKFKLFNITRSDLYIGRGLTVNMDANIIGTLTIGAGTLQTNITLTSPDGTEFTCGVNNSGSYNCN